MRLDQVCGRRAALVSILAMSLSACSNASRIGGPTWNLTGGKGDAPLPPRPLDRKDAGNRPNMAAVPNPNPAQIIEYKGGRDPITGRAPSFGSTYRLEAPAQDGDAPARPATSPPPVQQHPLIPPARPSRPKSVSGAYGVTVAGTRQIEVMPGQTLSTIAEQHRLSISALMAANNLRDPYVIPGQMLILPAR